MKASFLITAKEKGIITEKGVRAFIMERLLNSPFKRGTAFNVNEKTVEVQIEGDKEQIEKFRTELEKALITQFGNPGIVCSEARQNHALEIPLLMRSSQALMVGQLQKGIGVQLAILGALKNMITEMKETRMELSGHLKALREK